MSKYSTNIFLPCRFFHEIAPRSSVKPSTVLIQYQLLRKLMSKDSSRELQQPQCWIWPYVDVWMEDEQLWTIYTMEIFRELPQEEGFCEASAARLKFRSVCGLSPLKSGKKRFIGLNSIDCSTTRLYCYGMILIGLNTLVIPIQLVTS